MPALHSLCELVREVAFARAGRRTQQDNAGVRTAEDASDCVPIVLASVDGLRSVRSERTPLLRCNLEGDALVQVCAAVSEKRPREP
eukprot:3329655-Rhodomonas_salina.1